MTLPTRSGWTWRIHAREAPGYPRKRDERRDAPAGGGDAPAGGAPGH